MKRPHVSLKTKLAAALLQMRRYDDGEAAFVPVIPYEAAKAMTEDEIISKFHFDHGIAHAHDGVAKPWNLTPITVEDHKTKTAKIDVPRIAKSKRIVSSSADHRGLMLTKEPGQRRVKRSRIPSRPFDKGHRPLQSRGFR